MSEPVNRNRRLLPGILFTIFLMPPDALAVSGMARVVDGDTLTIGEERIRIFGIDAPEHDQTCGDDWTCGNAATEAMRTLTSGMIVSCEKEDRDRYGRLVATCRVGPVDVGRELVRQGLALAYRQFSMRYVEDENEARLASLGMWSGPFVAPWKWRKGWTEPVAASDESALKSYDDNGNGRISCAEARNHGIAPVSEDHPAYPFMRDSDGDGVVCE